MSENQIKAAKSAARVLAASWGHRITRFHRKPGVPIIIGGICPRCGARVLGRLTDRGTTFTGEALQRRCHRGFEGI